MCGLKRPTVGRIDPSSSWRPSTRTSWPISLSVSMTSYSIFHSASRTSIPVVSAGGTRWSCTSARMRSFFITGTSGHHETPVSSAVQVVHRLHRQQHGKLLPGAVLGHRQPQLQLAAAGDHVLEDLVDRVLVDPGPSRHEAARRPANARDELRRRHVVGELGQLREQAPQVAVVEIGIVDPVVPPLRAVMLAQRLLQPAQRIDFVGIDDARLADRRSTP